MTPPNYQRLIDRLGTKICTCKDGDVSGCNGTKRYKPILIGTVLAKMESATSNWSDVKEMIILWQMTGPATRSLKSISEDVEEVCMDCVEGYECSCDGESTNLTKILKPEARSLLDFLDNLIKD